jgi:hypothetical protein
MAESTASSRAVITLVGIIVLLAAAFAATAYWLNPASLGVDAGRFLAIALVGVLVTKRIRWARLLLMVLTGLAAAFAVVTAVSVAMAPVWKILFIVYGGGTIACLWGLFVQPAAAYFVAGPSVPKGGT